MRRGSSGVLINASRAADRSAAATPSSRSRITTSAVAAAFSNRSGRSAGQKSQPGPAVATVMTAVPWDACAPWFYASCNA
ncbi:Uncharacterised protein [Mycobacteroides abscessus subsp. abscessus]|nr:Uncharacterised protein [Mycobacteroides abscessus subsp. abscessus]